MKKKPAFLVAMLVVGWIISAPFWRAHGRAPADQAFAWPWAWLLSGTPLEASYVPRAYLAIRTPNTVTIGAGSTSVNSAAFTAVVMNLSYIEHKGCRGGGGSGDATILQLASTTQVNASRIWSSGSITCAFDVIQFNPLFVKSVQRNTLAVTGTGGGAVATIAVTPTTIASSTLHVLGCAPSDNATGVLTNWIGHMVQTSTGQLSLTTDAQAGNTITCSFELIEWR